MRVRKLLRRRMVTTGFADRGLFGAETESARKGLPEEAVSVVECVSSGADATPSPSRRGLKREHIAQGIRERLADATPSPSRRGLKPSRREVLLKHLPLDATPSPSRRGLKRTSRPGDVADVRDDATP